MTSKKAFWRQPSPTFRRPKKFSDDFCMCSLLSCKSTRSWLLNKKSLGVVRRFKTFVDGKTQNVSFLTKWWCKISMKLLRFWVNLKNQKLRFSTSSVEKLVETIFMKKVRKDPTSSNITDLKYHGHTTKTSF